MSVLRSEHPIRGTHGVFYDNASKSDSKGKGGEGNLNYFIGRCKSKRRGNLSQVSKDYNDLSTP